MVLTTTSIKYLLREETQEMKLYTVNISAHNSVLFKYSIFHTDNSSINLSCSPNSPNVFTRAFHSTNTPLKLQLRNS